MHRPKVVSQFESIPSYPDVDEGYFLHESFGKAVFRPKNWDVYAPEGIKRHIPGYEFKIDTGTSKGVYCRPPSYGHYEGEIIMKHVRALLDNTWIRECITGSYGAPIVLAPETHQEEIIDIKNFVWRMCVSYRTLNKVTDPFKYHIGRCDDAIENLNATDTFSNGSYVSINSANSNVKNTHFEERTSISNDVPDNSWG